MTMRPHETDQPESDLQPRARTDSVGLWVFLAALAMLFAAGMLGYAVIRSRAIARGSVPSLSLPGGLWLSTALMLAASIALQYALFSIREGRQRRFMQLLYATAALASGFVISQVFCLSALLSSHRAMRLAGSGLYGLVFFLIVLHALHVLGGLAALGRNIHCGRMQRYSQTAHGPVRCTVIYWHFLDAVWLLMFAMLLGLR